MKTILMSLGFILVMTGNIIAQSKPQNNSSLTDLDKKKILLINHLCVLKTMYVFSINSELDYRYRANYIEICKDYLNYSKNVFTDDIKVKVDASLGKKYDAIYESYSKLIENYDAIESDPQTGMRMLTLKAFADIQINEFIKALLSK